MKKLRKEDLSLHHFIRFNVLDEFIETDTDIPLTFLPDVSTSDSFVYEATSSRTPSPTSLGRGWVYLDAYGDVTEQQNAVTVYDSSNDVISGTEYIIDYVDGRVITSGTVTPDHVTYKYFYVSLVNEWQDIEAAGVPVVVINVDGFTKEGFQLGGGRRVPRKGRLHVFATNQAERDDLNEILYDGIYQKCVPNQNWTKGSMIDWNGTFQDDYVYELIANHSHLQFEDVEARNVAATFLREIPNTDLTMLSDLNRYRARISFNMCHIEEG